MATHSSVPAWRIPGTGAVCGVTQSQTRLSALAAAAAGVVGLGFTLYVCNLAMSTDLSVLKFE